MPTCLRKTRTDGAPGGVVESGGPPANYNPEPKLNTITAPVLWINSADDFINPPELGIAQNLVTRMPRAKFVLIPISDATRGHGTHTQAAVWKSYLVEFLRQTEKK